MGPTHYDVLGVAEDASYAEIRAAYLSAILSLHPDKQLSLAKVPGDEDESLPALSSARFHSLQEAWTTLRGSDSRSSYDRTLQCNRLLLNSAVSEDLNLDDMHKEGCNEDGSGEVVYIYPCRCGDCFSVWHEEVQAVVSDEHWKDDGRQIKAEMIVPCGSCSLKIRVRC